MGLVHLNVGAHPSSLNTIHLYDTINSKHDAISVSLYRPMYASSRHDTMGILYNGSTF